MGVLRRLSMEFMCFRKGSFQALCSLYIYRLEKDFVGIPELRVKRVEASLEV